MTGHSEPNGSGLPLTLDVASTILVRSAAQGFLGSMPIEDQVTHALGFRAAVEEHLGRSPESFLDLGTGGGIPGLVLAVIWPGSRAVLLDANERRTSFLVSELEGLVRSGQLEVVRGRAEEAGHDPALRGAFEVVTSRSFGSPAVTAECAAPLVRRGGFVVVSEPPDEGSSARWPADALASLGLRPVASSRYEGRFGYQVLEKVEETPDRYPRRVGIPAKRPLF